MRKSKVRMAGPLLAGAVVLAGVVTSPSAQAGFFCDTALRLCEAVPTTMGRGKCEVLAEEVCRLESSGRREEAREQLDRAKREYHS